MKDIFNIFENNSIFFRNIQDDKIKKVCNMISNEFIINLNEFLEANEKDINFMKRANIAKNSIKDWVLDKFKIYQICAYIVNVGGKPLLNSETITQKNIYGFYSVKKINNPIGRIALINDIDLYVTIVTIIMCIKSGNSVGIIDSNRVLNTDRLMIKIIQKCLNEAGFPQDMVRLYPGATNDEIVKMLNSKEYFDFAIFYGLGDSVNYIKNRSYIDFMTLYKDKQCIYIHDEYGINIIDNILRNGRFEYDKKFLVNNEIYDSLVNKLGTNICESLNIKKVRNLDEAISYINSSRNIITGCIFSNDKKADLEFQQKTLLNEVYINTVLEYVMSDNVNELQRRFFSLDINKCNNISPDMLIKSKYIIEKRGNEI